MQIESMVLTRFGTAEFAFERKEVALRAPKPEDVLIEVEAFGLNFADVMARLGLYPATPPLPAVLGYEVVGRVKESAHGLNAGQRVVALTRFGGYSRAALAHHAGVVPIPEDMPQADALALATQGITTVYMADRAATVAPHEWVLVHAAAGGVGQLLVQLALSRGCTIIGTAGSDTKVQKLRDAGVQYPINYQQADFEAVIRDILKHENRLGLDVIFDPVGGKSVAKGMKLLGPCGRMAVFGGSAFSGKKGWFGKISTFAQFGFYHPLRLMRQSQSLVGVNILTVADHFPEIIGSCLKQALAYYAQGVFHPEGGQIFPVADLARAHHLLETRQTTGKVGIAW